MSTSEAATRPDRTVQLEVAAATHVGMVREENQDSLLCHGWVTGRSGGRHGEEISLVPGAPPVLYAVIDGMGGHAGGAAAAATASAVLARELTTLDPDGIRAALAHADRTVATVGEALGTPEMGATVAGVLVDHDRALVMNVGDSRVYRYVDGYLGQLSVDDRVPAPGSPGRSYVAQSLGGPGRRVLDPHTLDQPHRPGATTYLLCSDGLHDIVDADAIRQALATGTGPVEAVTALVARALRAGAPDNVSVVVLNVQVIEG